MISAVLTSEFVISGCSPTRAVVSRIADDCAIAGHVQRISETVVRVRAVAKTHNDMDKFIAQIVAAFRFSLGPTSSPETSAIPVICESNDPECIRIAILGSFTSVWSKFKASFAHLSANSGAAPSSQSSASRGMGEGGGGGHGSISSITGGAGRRSTS